MIQRCIASLLVTIVTCLFIIPSSRQMPASAATSYKLPWPSNDSPQEVIQGACPGGTGSGHCNTQEQWSYDFDLPEGTPVLAVASGIVRRADFNWDNDHCGNETSDPDYRQEGNRVVIDDEDGLSSQLYLHLMKTQLVAVDQRVSQGDLIGYSGKTGYSDPECYPHLHFQLQEAVGANATAWITNSKRIDFDEYPNSLLSVGIDLNSGNRSLPSLVEGDFNRDGKINSFDWNIMLLNWNLIFNHCGNTTDLNDDCRVNSIDRSILLEYWRTASGSVMLPSGDQPSLISGGESSPHDVVNPDTGLLLKGRSTSESIVLAAQSPSLSLSPSSVQISPGDTFNISLILNAVGAQAVGTDITLLFDSSKVEARTISTGGLFSDHPLKSIRPGRVDISGATAGPGQVGDSGIFATVTFASLLSAAPGATTIRVDFDVNNRQRTTDSNVVDHRTATDVLNSVSDATFTISRPNTSASGIVRRSTDGHPVAGAVISIDGVPFSAITDGSGRFNLANIAVGPHNVQVTGCALTPTDVGITLSSQGNSDLSLSVTPSVETLHSGRLYMTSGGIVDTATDQIIGNITTSAPNFGFSTAIHPDGSRLYLMRGTELITVDTGSNAIISADVITNSIPTMMVINHTGDKLYLSNWLPNVSTSIVVWSTGENRILSTISLPNKTMLFSTQSMVMSPTGDRLYVLLADLNATPQRSDLLVINTSNGLILRTIPLGILVGDGMAVSPDGNSIYLGGENRRVRIIDANTYQLLGESNSLPIRPTRLAFSRNGACLYMTLQGADSSPSQFAAMDPITLRVLTTAQIGHGSGQLVTHPGGSRIYVTSQTSGTVSIIDTVVNSVIGTINVGINPRPGGAAVSTHIPVPPPPPCSPRPNVRVVTAPIGGGRLRVTLIPQTNAGMASNTLTGLTFTRMDNATVQMNGTAVSVGSPVVVPANAQQLQFDVIRRGQGATTVHFTVRDACGDWPSFVGSGWGS